MMVIDKVVRVGNVTDSTYFPLLLEKRIIKEKRNTSMTKKFDTSTHVRFGKKYYRKKKKNLIKNELKSLVNH